MIDLFCKTGILLGAALLILQVGCTLKRSEIVNFCFFFLKSFASSDVDKEFFPAKCLKDNNVTEQEYKRDRILRFHLGEVKNCSRLCFYVQKGYFDENGNILVNLEEDWIVDDACKVNSMEDKCIKAYQFGKCFYYKVRGRELQKP